MGTLTCQPRIVRWSTVALEVLLVLLCISVDITNYACKQSTETSILRSILDQSQQHIHCIVQGTSAIAGQSELNIGPEIGRYISIATHSGPTYAVYRMWKLEFIGYSARGDTGPAIFGWVTITTR